ncbi:MAG TPA: hypothetical protein VEK14_05480, partial [Rhodomicrobium sp.]|nr:hypothetical protein [Rhodomicrobium sp.]
SGLVSDRLSKADTRLVAWRLSINPLVCVVALFIAFVSTTAAILLYLVTPIWYILTGSDAYAGDAGTWRFPWQSTNPRSQSQGRDGKQ